MGETLGSAREISTKLQRIAELARNAPETRGTIAHHLDLACLREAYRRTRPRRPGLWCIDPGGVGHGRDTLRPGAQQPPTHATFRPGSSGRFARRSIALAVADRPRGRERLAAEA
jgi:hypothetical protein